MMGEAARKARASALVSVLIPERGRPEQLDRLITALIEAAGADENYEIIVQWDDDDEAWRDRTPHEHVRTRYLRRPRAPTLGEKLNQLAQEARGGIIAWLANDVVMETRGWPARYREAGEKLPNGIGVMYPRDPLHPDHASYYAMTREMYAGVGIFAPPWFPYWFCDTWWTEVGVLTNTMQEIDADVTTPEGRGKTHALVDLPFWVQFFEDTRPLRLRDAVQLIGVAHGQESDRARAELAQIGARQAMCEARTAHMRSPLFLERWGGQAESPPAASYPEVKEIAERLVEDIRKQAPRRVRVALCVPSGRTWEAASANSVAALAAYSSAAGIDCSFINVQSSQISHSRNKTVEIALGERQDFLFWIDSDMVMPPDTLIKLMRHNKDICGATYNRRTHPYQTLGRLKGPMPDPGKLRGGLHEAELLPSGMLLVNAEVYRKLPKPWYAECYRWPGKDNLASFKAMMRDYYANMPPDDVLASLDGTPFGDWIAAHGNQSAEVGETFENFGEDNYWIRKCRKAGYQAWCCLDTTFTLKHLGVLEVTCDLPAEMKEAAD
jgi:glycosyltransferase involved in cell wall biosynthesis